MTAASATPPPDAPAHEWTHRHLLSMADLSPADIRFLLQTARSFEEVSTRSVKKVPALRGKVVVNLFFEPSTRTKSSFFLAAQRLSADVLDFSGSSSSEKKGETLRDTARNIEAMGVDIIVCRHASSGAAQLVARNVACSVVNAGDGQHEHPTQALLDLYTIGQRLGATDMSRFAFDFAGLHVAIVGDIAHSRVARSNIVGLQKLGATVHLVGPPTLLPGSFAADGCVLHTSLDDVLPQLDVINMLRVQFERLTSPAFPSTREYSAIYGLTAERLKRMRKDVLVMHPGPINRGLELESAVADGPSSMILKQVSNGLAVRMASLFLVNQAAAQAAGRTP